ncbi:MAG: hypothetical protein E6X17_08555 [Sporomusaceae bacterium]|nr:hypothetical protein [Sporomusaceae bacterium]
MEKILQQLLDGQKQLFDGQKQLFEEVRQIKTTLDENVQVTKGLVNWTEEINAQVHGMGHTLAKLEGKVNQLEGKVDHLGANAAKTHEQVERMASDVIFLVRKASEHEQDIRQLSRAK